MVGKEISAAISSAYFSALRLRDLRLRKSSPAFRCDGALYRRRSQDLFDQGTAVRTIRPDGCDASLAKVHTQDTRNLAERDLRLLPAARSIERNGSA